jgi:hypothetical protein
VYGSSEVISSACPLALSAVAAADVGCRAGGVTVDEDLRLGTLTSTV